MKRRLRLFIATGARRLLRSSRTMCGRSRRSRQSWPVGDAYLRQSEAALPAVTYRDIFRDPRLQALIEQALVNNRDLQIAAANIAAARAQYRIQRAERFPEVDASAGVTVDPATATGVGRHRRNIRRGVGVTSFELDLFGRIALADRRPSSTAISRPRRRARDAADPGRRHRQRLADLCRRREPAQDRRRRRRRAPKRASASRAPRLEGGIAPRTDLRQAEQILRPARADLANQRTAVAQDVNLLQLLVGAPIDARLLPRSIDEAAPTIAELPAGLEFLRAAAPPRRRAGRISTARGQRRDRRRARGAVPAHLADRPARLCQQLR